MQAPTRLPVAAEHQDGLFNDDESGIAVPHLMVHARDDHGELGLLEVVELIRVDLLGDLQRLPVAPQTAFAIGLDSAVHIEARQASSGADITQSLGVMAGQITGNAGGLPHDGNSSGMRDGITGMPVGQFGVRVEQPLNHDEMTRDVLSVGPTQGAQLTARRGLQTSGLDICRYGRFRHTGALRRTPLAPPLTAVIRGPTSATFLFDAGTATPTRVRPATATMGGTARSIAVKGSCTIADPFAEAMTTADAARPRVAGAPLVVTPVLGHDPASLGVSRAAFGARHASAYRV